ncbi:MAG: amidohydrolase family protein [Streptosporangiales bacterium]|nr:amidohydrolase family protein [Streptosporangiales bacterium]
MNAPDIELRDVRLGPGGPIGCVRVVGGRVVEIGANPDPSADCWYDGGGRTVLPGLRDAHTHMVQWATARRRVDVSSAQSPREAVDLVVAAPRDDKVVVGHGFRDATWSETPHKDLWERALPGVPVMLLGNDLHTAWLSPAALALVGRPEHPTGVLVEQECYAAAVALPQTGADRLDRLVADAAAAAAARGITGILDFEYADNVTDWLRRAAAYDVPLRVTCAIPADRVDEAIERGLRTGDLPAEGGGRVRVGPVKLFADGSLNTRTALCDAPYASAVTDHPHGRMELAPDELERRMRHAWDGGLHLAVHAIGDHANAIVLDAFERIGCPGRIEHAQLVRPGDLHRFARPGLVAGVQPAHQPDDRDVADLCWPQVAQHAFPYGALHAAGATLEFGSDAPVAPLDPWDGIASAVARTDDDRPPWHPEQAMPFEAALAASCGGRTAVTVGDTADLVLVDDDPGTLTPHDLRDIGVHATMLGGRWTYGPEARR